MTGEPRKEPAYRRRVARHAFRRAVHADDAAGGDGEEIS